MIVIRKHQEKRHVDIVSIEIEVTDVEEQMDMLRKAISAAFRWRGYVNDSDTLPNDGEHLITLSMLLDSISYSK